MSKGWTDERRKAQAERCRRNKPWEKSTGPKTAAGKNKSRLNALKHGHYAIGYNAIHELLRANRTFRKYMFIALAYQDQLTYLDQTERKLNEKQKVTKAVEKFEQRTEESS